MPFTMLFFPVQITHNIAHKKHSGQKTYGKQHPERFYDKRPKNNITESVIRIGYFCQNNKNDSGQKKFIGNVQFHFYPPNNTGCIDNREEQCSNRYDIDCQKNTFHFSDSPPFFSAPRGQFFLNSFL
jgi:hypothetical protein